MKGTLARMPTLLVGATAIACQSGTQPRVGGAVCPVQSAAAPAGAAIARALAAAIPDASRNTMWSVTNGVTLARSEEHTSELQSPCNLVCRLLLEKKKQQEILFFCTRKKKKLQKK